MSALSPQEQREIYNEIVERRSSRSPLRNLGSDWKGDLGDVAYNTDGTIHMLGMFVTGCILGDPDTLAALNKLANANLAQYPDRVYSKRLAQAMLNFTNGQKTATSAPPTGETPGVIPAQKPSAPVYRPTPAPTPVPQAQLPVPYSSPAPLELDDVGKDIGDTYSALKKLGLADALPIEDRAPLAMLVKVLQSKNGSEL